MNKLLAAVLMILAGSIFAFSQTETKTEPAWTTFVPEIEEFSVEIPVSLKARSSGYATLTKDESRRYENTLDGTYFYIFSDSQKLSWQLEMVRKFVKLYKEAGTTENSEDFEIERFVFIDREDFHHTVLVVKSRDRIYGFQTVSPTKENPLVERFFKSLKFTAKATAESNKNKDVIVTIPTDEIEIRRATPPSGSENGLESGIGLGAQPQSIPRPSITNPNRTEGVRILSKPRALYTDFARFYEINGKVALRVTFMANGTIGAVTPFTKLPFGLTEQAIAAAKALTFQPAMREGTPYNVSKMVEYGFTIY